MGISGLLPFVKKASKNSDIKNYKGYTVGVDGFCWLHKGAFGCATKLAIGTDTDAYVTYFMKYINVLLENCIKPVVVFDGRSLPAKEITNQKRRESRAENKKKGKELLLSGKNDHEAWKCFTKSVEITHEMVRNVIKVLQSRNIDYIIAPYEADAQLTYLACNGMVDIVITEDSDLIPFGCPKIIFKLKLTGECVLFDNSKVHACMDVPLAKFQFERFRQMCILSGCDYLPSLPGVGLSRAKKFFKSLTQQDIRKALKQLPSMLNMDLEVPDEYIDEFIKAENTFLYQIVFDPRMRKLIPLTEYSINVNEKDMSYAGTRDLNHHDAIAMATGNLDTINLQRVANFNVDMHRGYCIRTSIWSKEYIIPPKRNAVTELKSATKHSSTAGLKASISLRALPAKRRLRVEEEAEETDIVALYLPQNTCNSTNDHDSAISPYFKESPSLGEESPYFQDSSSSGESPASKKSRTTLYSQ